MAVRSGCNGKVLVDAAVIAHVRNWSFSWVVEIKTYASSSTACTTKRVAGPKDVTNGRVEVYIDDADRVDANITPGDIVALSLYEDAADFWLITDAMITGIEPSTNIEDGDIVGAAFTFEGGTVTKPT